MRVLVVDDEPDTLLLVRANLERLGHECTVTENADEAQRICEEDRPDVLLLDVAMPGTDGPTLLANLRRGDLAPERVMLISARPPEELAELANTLGVHYLTKPFTAEEFRTKLNELARVA